LEFGAKSVLGVEGEWAQEFNTSRKDVLFRNLTTELFLYRKFDICLSLEVAEHIPKEFADVFIKNLVNASDIIIFSAAIPGQGGTNHVNLQYPNYWSAKFREMGFSLLEDPRKSIPGRHKLAPWYRQNLLVYSRTDSANMQSQNIVPTTIRDPLIFPNKWSPKFYVYRLLRKLHSRSPGE
jgi:hypothetical protein